MAHFVSLLPLIWPWFILIAGMVSAASGRRQLGLTLLLVFGLAALVLGLVTPLAVGIVAAGLLGAAALNHLTGIGVAVGHVMLIGWCLALGAHLVPGFQNLMVLDRVYAGPDSSAFSMYLNLDKPMVLFAVLLAWPGMTDSARPVRRTPLLVGLATLPALFAVGLAAQAIRPELSLPPWWLIFAFSNLFLTCLTEEAFFHGYLQSLIASKLGAALGVTLAGLLFGLAHFPGGPALVAYAAILGAACGLGFYATGRLWVPVLMHFGFNAVHLFLFTYPASA
ncbi:CPBP family intramembrane glutamic endopeptidase [Ruegeria atlantica]|uniref:CAAX amino terminal protease self-immunity n=1 Tax=Ruegeria atlantica TaxID=81569 RepID=A0A0P1EPN4_9RHOB|nr:CPBP family intramembrane glutamic endopeptidase [Ruegeria atlantica]CUH43610.1 CAAX amino terminal protease self-immunity [Ruegeria atlantica]